jgi:valyl-tRNA synthetase
VVGDPEGVSLLEKDAPTLARMAKIDAPRFADQIPPGSAQIVVRETTIAFPLGEAIDLEAEQVRLSKAAEAAEKERDSLAQRLANPNFTERAKPEAVEKARADHDAKAAEAGRLRAALERLG